MKNLEFYKIALNCNTEDQVLNFLISTLKPSNTIWSYFVNWEKVFTNTKQIELALNNLNYLTGKDNFDDELKFLLKENPNVAKVIPALVVRDGKNTKKFNILVDYQKKKLVYENYDFSKKDICDKDIEKSLQFVKETGLKDLIVMGGKIVAVIQWKIGYRKMH